MLEKIVAVVIAISWFCYLVSNLNFIQLQKKKLFNYFNYRKINN